MNDSGTTPAPQLLEIAPTFRYDQPSLLAHHLVGHPLLTLEALAALARRLPKNQVRFYAVHDVSVGTDLETVVDKHGGGLTLDDALERIEQKRSYVFLQNIETDPVYRELVDACMAEVGAVVEPQDPGIVARFGWVFLSAPGAVTPYHRDHEKTFLFQIRGRKTLSVFDCDDRSVVSLQEDESFHSDHTLREVVYRPEIEPRGRRFELEPGRGLYMPFSAPHWVQNGGEVSISFSVTYHTRSQRRIERIFQMNRYLRRLGLTPSDRGSVVRDAVKAATVSGLRAARSLTKRAPREGRY